MQTGYSPSVDGCHHHAYFRFMTFVDPLNTYRGAPKRPACIACEEHRSDEWCRHRLEEAYELGTAEPDGVLR